MKIFLRVSIVFFVLLIIGIIPLYSQSYQLVRADTLITSPIFDGNIENEFKATAELKNISSTTKTTKVRITPIYMTPGHKYAYCAPGQCYPETDTTSESQPWEMETNTTTGNYFTLDFYVYGHPGISCLTIKFFDANNPNDKIEYGTCCNALPSSVEDGDGLATVTVMSYPNPATNFVNLKYNFPFASSNIKCNIYNYAGSFISYLPVAGQAGNLNINTSELINGSYYYVFVKGNQKIIDGNFTVLH
ncbi:MAG: T9SS type A sorting domain-containing protein [Bacteroidota bacterium]|jgi:hypothetical protein